MQNNQINHPEHVTATVFNPDRIAVEAHSNPGAAPYPLVKIGAVNAYPTWQQIIELRDACEVALEQNSAAVLTEAVKTAEIAAKMAEMDAREETARVEVQF